MAQEPNINNNEESCSAKASQDELKKLELKSEEYLNGWKRERADFLNYKKDEMERIGQLVKYANEEIILKVLPILDNLYLAESHVPEELKNHDWIKGFNQIKSQLADFLAKEGIEVIETLRPGSGQAIKFDPSLMEAVEEVKMDGTEPGIVVEETQRGYTMAGKIIRPAKVKISK